MKYLLLFIFLFCAAAVQAQDECPHYKTYILKGKLLLEKQYFDSALKAYSIALLHCPDNADEARKGIIDAFNGINSLKELAEKNAKEARENAEKAIEAKFLSDAYKFIFFAQEAVKNDPTLALHLADTALKILDSVKTIEKTNSSIFDKAQRIYYENNFGETMIGSIKPGDPFGHNIKAMFAPDGKSIWTITDSAFAIQWNLNGDTLKTIPLDTSKKNYKFIQADQYRVIIHGYTWKETKARGKLWDITQSNNPIEIPDFLPESSIAYFAGRDSSNGWAQRLIVLGNKAFSLDEKGNLIPSVNGNSGNTTHIALSADGQKIAYNTGQRTIEIKDSKSKIIGKITNTGNKVEELAFSPDKNVLLVETDANIQLFIPSKKMNTQAANPPEYTGIVPSISLFGYKIHTYKFSPDGKMLLISFGNPTTQVARLFKINPTGNQPLELFAQYICPGSNSTSAVFSINPKDSTILTSSDKVRTWKIRRNKTQPAPNMARANKESEFYVAVDYNAAENLFFGYTASGKKIKFQTDGTEYMNLYPDSTYQSDSMQVGLVGFSPDELKVAIVSENGSLNLYHIRQIMQGYLKNFRFEPFTDAQKRKYGIK